MAQAGSNGAEMDKEAGASAEHVDTTSHVVRALQAVNEEDRLVLPEGLSAEHVQALMKVHHHNSLARQIMALDLTQGISLGLERVRGQLRGEMQSLRQHMDNNFAAAGEVFEKKLSLTDGKIEETKKELTERMDTQHNEIKKMVHKDVISDAWITPSMINLRQIVALIERQGLDLGNQYGGIPLFSFTFFPGRPQTRENHLTVISRPLIRLATMLSHQFTPPMSRGLLSDTVKNIIPTFGCVTLSASACSVASGAFGIGCSKQSTEDVFVFPTLKLARALNEERSQIADDRAVLLEENDIGIVSSFTENGAVKIEVGGGIDEEHLSDARSQFSRITTSRNVTPVTFKHLYDHAIMHFPKEQDITFAGVVEFLSHCRFWNMPAPREYRAQLAVRMGLDIVRKEVFGLESVAPEDGNYTVTDGWTLTLPSKKQEPVPDFATLMAKRMGLKSSKEFTQFFKRYFDNAIQRLRAEHASGKKRRGNGSTQKKGKARRISKPLKPTASAAAGDDEAVADEDVADDAEAAAGDEDTADADAAADEDKEDNEEGDKEDGDKEEGDEGDEEGEDDEDYEEGDKEEATLVTPTNKPVLRRR